MWQNIEAGVVFHDPEQQDEVAKTAHGRRLSAPLGGHFKEDALRMAEAAVIRMMSRIVLHIRKPEEPWLQWHKRTWRQSKGAVAKTRGCTPAVVVAACAASMVVRLATRAACRTAGLALSWGSHADAQVLKEPGRGRMGEGARRRI